MANGTTDPSSVQFVTDQGEFPTLELLLFGPPSIGQQLVITVFEETLFMHGALKALHNKAFSRFNGFGEQTLLEELTDASSLITDGSNGVLLQLSAPVLGAVPENAAAAHRKWALGEPSDIAACAPDDPLVQIAFGFRDIDNTIQFAPESVIRIPRVTLKKTLRLYVVVADKETHEIVYSNGWQNDPRNRPGRPTLVSAKAPQGAFKPKVAGSGIGSGEVPPNPSTPVDDDITGLYEAYQDASHDPSSGVVPTLMVQLNQAGHAFAGWFCTPPDNITSLAHLAIPKQAMPTALDGVAHGVLLGQFAEQPKFSWGPVPNEFEDPSQFFMKAGHTGTINVINPRRLEMTIRRADDEVKLFLRQMEPTPRWSEAGMQTIVARVDPTAGTGSILATKIRQGLRAKQSVPVPQMYWNKIGLDMTEEGELGRLIIEHRATSGPEQDVVRAKINNYLRGLTGVEARYHELIRVHFIALANGTELEIDGELKTVFDWLKKIQEELIGDIDEDADPEVVLEFFTDPGFREMGVVPLAVFAYEFEFLAAGTSAPLPAGLAAGAYVMAVKFRRKVLGGTEEENDRWQEGDRFTRALFWDIGMGFSAKFKAGPSSSSPSKITFRTTYDLNPSDFNHATFYTITGKLLSAGNSFVSVDGPNSAVMVMTVATTRGSPGEVQLVGGVDSWYSPPSLTTQQFKKHDAKPQLTLFSLSMGYGYFFPGVDPVPDPPPGETPVKEELGKARIEMFAFFRRNSASLESRSLAAVEEAFAVEKAMFVSGGGRCTSIGNASPEGPDNQTLSQKRAQQVIDAAKNAFGQAFALDPVEVIGRGSALAESEGMLKPPVSAEQQALYDEQYESQFPRFRFVLLQVENVPLLKVTAHQVTPGG